MIYRQNLHTHNVYCDGRGTLREFTLAAIDQGLEALGFSCHSYQYFSPVYTISEENTVKYKAEIKALKEEFEGKIRLYAGLEVDMLSRPDVSGLDYTIGSSHWMKLGDDFVEFDKRIEIFQEILDKYFDGDIWAFLEKYYSEISLLSTHGRFDVVGHFDLVTRHCESEHPFFDRSDKRYLDLAKDAIHNIVKDIRIFEVNVGCFAYGTGNIPYPEPELIREIKAAGGSVIITNDAHDREKLSLGLDRGVEIIKSAGFDEVMIMTDHGFDGMKI
ncbi:MAG: PHP domain-containing protein [Oscillospiraceae bacterium]|nr:PHP domain-containing protein [Oscillospiraceae bacterium]